MRPETLEFQALSEAILSARLQTDAGLVDDWVYTDEDGLEALHVLLLESEDDHRRHVRMVWPDLTGKWFMGEPKRPWPLYGLMELAVGQRVYVCQSEAAVQEARRAGLTATTCALGHNGVGSSDWTPLGGRDLVILPNNDESGRTFARRVAAALDRLPSRSELRVLQLPGLSLHGDLIEFGLKLRPAAPADIGDRIEALVERTPEFELVRGLSARRRPAAALPSALRSARLADLRPATVRWLWPGRIPLGKLSLLFGGPGEGKSLIAADLAARVSTGAAWPDGGGAAPGGAVLLLCGQDALGDMVRPRLDRAGADLARVTALGAPGPAAGAGRISLAGAMERALAAQRAAGCAVRLALIDPVSGFLGGDVCAAMAELSAVAERSGVAVVMVTGLGRGHAGLQRPAALGGGALLSAAQLAWLATPDDRDPGRRLLLPAKCNLGDRSPGLAYRVAGGTVQWEPAAVAVGPEEVMQARRRRKSGPPADKQAQAARWLQDRLAAGPACIGGPDSGVGAEGAGDEPTDSLRRQGRAAGFSYTTLRRAYFAVNAVSERCPKTGRFYWRLQSQGTAGPKAGV
jgi:hypothetical protein